MDYELDIELDIQESFSPSVSPSYLSYGVNLMPIEDGERSGMRLILKP